MPDFCSGRQLRDYQKLSLDWMASNWAVRRNCILGDEVRGCKQRRLQCPSALVHAVRLLFDTKLHGRFGLNGPA